MREAADLLVAATDARRVELGKRWKQVYEEAGLTHQTLNRWRNGHPVDPLTERALERALAWAPGARESIAAGRTPAVLNFEPTEQQEAPQSAPTLAEEVEVARRAIAALVDALQLTPGQAEEAFRRVQADIVRTHSSGTDEPPIPRGSPRRAG